MILLVLANAIVLAIAQQLPENVCSQYFQYVQGSIGGFEGELTLPMQNGRNRIDMRFSQRGTQDQDVVGALLPHPDELTLNLNFPAGKFRLSLRPNAAGMLPKLTRLSYNEAILCTGSEYGPPNSYFDRFYEIHFDKNQSPRRLTPQFTTFGKEQSDVEVKTLLFETPVGQQLPQDAIPQLVTDWLNEKPSTSAGVWRASAWPPQTTRSSTAVFQTWRDWPAATSTNTITIATQPPPPPPPVVPPVPATPSSNNRFDTASIYACGQEGRGTPFIQRGQIYPRGRYPWLTAVYHKESFSLIFRCGGSLISASRVITAGHCVHKMKEDRVLLALGRYDLDNYSEEGAETRDVIHILVHPDYSSRLQSQPDADIALVTLDRPVIFNDIINPICLWESSETETVAEFGFIAGWGTDEDGNAMTRYPREVQAKIATDVECARKWRVQKVLQRTLCAGNLDGSGPCLGDSGGGLMVKRNNRWLLRGVVSQGERSTVSQCNLNQYVLYCDLSKHLTWISENVR